MNYFCVCVYTRDIINFDEFESIHVYTYVYTYIYVKKKISKRTTFFLWNRRAASAKTRAIILNKRKKIWDLTLEYTAWWKGRKPIHCRKKGSASSILWAQQKHQRCFLRFSSAAIYIQDATAKEVSPENFPASSPAPDFSPIESLLIRRPLSLSLSFARLLLSVQKSKVVFVHSTPNWIR